MFEPKNLLINCDICDARSIKEEDYAAYEKIILNTDYLIVNETSKSILNRLPLTLNHDQTIELPDGEDVRLVTVNGSSTIEKSTHVLPHTILIVNGALTIAPDAGEALQNYDRIVVNGVVRCPDSLDGLMSIMTVNGSVDAYPADHTLLKSNFVLDAYFPLRAKRDGKYYARRSVVVKDPAVDLDALIEKNVSFRTGTLVTLAEKTAACAALFDEQVEFIVVPEDMTLIDDDCTVDAALLKKHGKRLFVFGDAKLGDGFETLEKLHVTDTLSVTEAQRDAIASMDVAYGALKVLPKGRQIAGQLKVRIDEALLSASPDGIFVQGVAKVVLDEGLSPETILEKLHFSGCAHIDCTEAQESAVATVSENVAHIGKHDEDDENTPLQMLKKALGTKIINADRHLM